MHGIYVWVPTCDTCKITSTEIAMKGNKKSQQKHCQVMQRTNCNKNHRYKMENRENGGKNEKKNASARGRWVEKRQRQRKNDHEHVFITCRLNAP